MAKRWIDILIIVSFYPLNSIARAVYPLKSISIIPSILLLTNKPDQLLITSIGNCVWEEKTLWKLENNLETIQSFTKSLLEVIEKLESTLSLNLDSNWKLASVLVIEWTVDTVNSPKIAVISPSIDLNSPLIESLLTFEFHLNLNHSPFVITGAEFKFLIEVTSVIFKIVKETLVFFKSLRVGSSVSMSGIIKMYPRRIVNGKVAREEEEASGSDEDICA